MHKKCGSSIHAEAALYETLRWGCFLTGFRNAPPNEEGPSYLASKIHRFPIDMQEIRSPTKVDGMYQRPVAEQMSSSELALYHPHLPNCVSVTVANLTLRMQVHLRFTSIMSSTKASHQVATVEN